MSRGQAKNLEVCWHPLRELTQKEKADVEKTEAETDKIRIESGVLYPQDLALARSGKKSNGEVVIDEKHLAETLAAEKDLALNPPPLVAPLTPGGQTPPGEEGEPPVEEETTE
jgi:hypothetical protein